VTAANFDLEHRTIIIPAHVAKAKRDQVIPLHSGLVEMVRRLCDGKGRDEPILTIPDKKCVNRNLRHDCKLAEVDTKNVSFHSLRHTFCTLLARANVHPALLQKFARHADLKTTLGYYVHLQRADEMDAINRV
jgi:integrase